MKTKIFTPLLCLLMLAIVAGCNWHKSKIAAEAKQLNDECPKSLGNGMMLTSVELDHDFMVYNVSVNAETFVDVVENAKSPLASKMFSSMIVDDLDADERQVLLDAEVGIKYVYKCETGETRTVTVSSQEFAEAVKHPLKGKALLDVQLSILKGRLPMDVGAGMKMVNAEFKNGNLCCEIDVTSAGLEMSELQTITEKNAGCRYVYQNRYPKRPAPEHRHQSRLQHSLHLHPRPFLSASQGIHPQPRPQSTT